MATSTASFYSSNNCSVNNDMKLGWGVEAKKNPFEAFHEKELNPNRGKASNRIQCVGLPSGYSNSSCAEKLRAKAKALQLNGFERMRRRKTTRENIKRFSRADEFEKWKRCEMEKPLFSTNSRDTMRLK